MAKWRGSDLQIIQSVCFVAADFLGHWARHQQTGKRPLPLQPADDNRETPPRQHWSQPQKQSHSNAQLLNPLVAFHTWLFGGKKHPRPLNLYCGLNGKLICSWGSWFNKGLSLLATAFLLQCPSGVVSKDEHHSMHNLVLSAHAHQISTNLEFRTSDYLLIHCQVSF